MSDRDKPGEGDDPGSAPQTDAPDTDTSEGLSPALIATLVTIPVVVIVVLIAYLAINKDSTASTPADDLALTATADKDCAPLLRALPEDLGKYGDRAIDGTTARWHSGDATTVLRCGVPKPPQLRADSALQLVSGVQWLNVHTDDSGELWINVDHRPYVALWRPVDAGVAPIADITELIAKVLTPGPLEINDTPVTSGASSPAPSSTR